MPRPSLSDAQADATAKNDHGETALDLALAGDCREAVELLGAATIFEQVKARSALNRANPEIGLLNKGCIRLLLTLY